VRSVALEERSARSKAANAVRSRVPRHFVCLTETARAVSRPYEIRLRGGMLGATRYSGILHPRWRAAATADTPTDVMMRAEAQQEGS
jgi:hypothetical protein